MEINLKDIIPEVYLRDNEAKDTEDNLIDMSKDVVQFGERSVSVGKAIFTTVIRVKGSSFFSVVPIKTNKPVSMSMWIDISKALSRLRVGPPLKIGDVLCKNILNTGIDIICTRNINRD